MLSHENNELYCRVGPGTPMGSWWRQFWVPVLRSSALEADGDPQRVRVFGENYAAFRGADGRVGVLDEACPHRGASLVLGRNEDCVLRCVYHGWAVNADGVVTETPNDPTYPHPEMIPVRRAPVREAGGMIWAWFGQGEPTPFPEFLFNTLPAGSHVRTTVGYVKSNWTQLIENLLDPLHAAILHAPGHRDAYAAFKDHPAFDIGSPVYEAANTPPKRAVPPTRIEFEQVNFGFRTRVAHDYAGTNMDVWSATVMPAWRFARGASGDGSPHDRIVIGHVPVDDETTMQWIIAFNPEQPLGAFGSVYVDTAPDPDNWVPAGYVAARDWMQDRKAMRERRSFTGLGLGYQPYSVFMEDVAMCESMGAIPDRTKERLCGADSAIIQARKVYLEAARAMAEGGPAFAAFADVSRVGLHDGPEHAREPGEGVVSRSARQSDLRTIQG